MNTSDLTNAYFPDDDADDSTQVPQQIGRYRIDSILGEGSFGIVYLAYDPQLQRRVAIKVPHARVLQQAQSSDDYMSEARTLASLDYPNIVPVHDVGSTSDCPFFIVSKYIEGRSLATLLRTEKLSFDVSTKMVSMVADALHYAHRRGFVHRDIKPGNILIDRSGVPFVVDFGLALKEDDLGSGPRIAGTPAYMSPEQARGESHRVDGRSDLFSLGVVFYELLTGRRPFTAQTQDELIQQIITFDPRPPRQLDDSIPRELDRICLKTLSKRASDRYSTAVDLADDLRHFLTQRLSMQTHVVSDTDAGTSIGPQSATKQPQVSDHSSGPLSATSPASTGTPLRIVPKGLRSFDAHDSDFFLELLPGPRDRNGLPESLRFWKSRIDELDPQQTFSVGLICGPSGCGKSSFMKAALLPRLGKNIISVYLEATADETETRLLNGLRRQLPALSSQWGLKESLAAIRLGQGMEANNKVVLVLDQFEQWLHARELKDNTELVQALRQCDGTHLQCVVMVRDDFWMAIIRFMRELEIRLVDGHNSAAIDLFPIPHAQRVLSAFGRAFGALPESADAITAEHRHFINQVVQDLTEDGKIICVRLALFAEMMKGKPWTPAGLVKVGGAEGIGVTFLEETFGSSSPPEHRYHEKAARSVLKALLPETGSQIKGHLRSYNQLLLASDYRHRPDDFDALIGILDREVRLITPTDPGGQINENDVSTPTDAGQKYYQLTHDYLVPSLRDWLTRKQRETKRGRAELQLAERATVWTLRPENRQLPSFWQWLGVRRWTRKANWTPAEHKMMSKAMTVHFSRLVVTVLVLLIVGSVGREAYGRLVARTLNGRLLEATTSEVPGIVQEMAPYRRWVNVGLTDAIRQAKRDNNARKQLHASIALLPVDSGQVDYLLERLLSASPQEVAVIRRSLHGRRDQFTDRLWEYVEQRQNPPEARFRAACALVQFTPDDARWEQISSDVASLLVAQKTFEIGQWVDLFRGAGRWLLPPMVDFLIDERRSMKDRGLIATVYGAYAPFVADPYRRLEQILEERNSPDAPLDLQTALAKRQSSVGVALLALGQSDKFWPLLKHQPDPTMRTFLIDRLAPGGADPKLLLARLGVEPDVSIRRAIVLSLGEMGLDVWPPSEREITVPALLSLYRNDPDPGLHAAVRWLLRQCQVTEPIAQIDTELATGVVEGQRQWYVNRQAQTLAVFARPGEVTLGQKTETVFPRHRHLLDRSFAIGSYEVTVEQFLRYDAKHEYVKRLSSTPDCPINKVTWFDAVAYCNWLSTQEGIPSDQWCYEPTASGSFGPGMKPAPNYLHRTGYRLPTEWEWEYACRAEADTMFFFAEPEEAFLSKYVWYDVNSNSRISPVGLLKPNDFGLFDIHGNVYEWAEDRWRYPNEFNDLSGVKVDSEEVAEITAEVQRVLRSGSFLRQTGTIRCTTRIALKPTAKLQEVGLRVARTMKAD